MKLFTSAQISDIEEATILEHKISSAVLMDRAACAFMQWFSQFESKFQTISIISGSGHNGADGLCIADKLLGRGYSVKVGVVLMSKAPSSLWTLHLNNLLYTHNINITYIRNVDDLTPLLSSNVLIDAILGTGLNRPVTFFLSDIIKAINLSKRRIYSVDIPSGLPSDTLPFSVAIKSYQTLSFEFPKRSFFFDEAKEFVPNWDYAPIQLSQNAIKHTPTNISLLTQELVSAKLPRRHKHSHKGDFGRVWCIGSDKSMPGAAFMSTLSAMIVGAGYGILCTNQVISTLHQPQIMVKTWANVKEISNSATTVAIGPGLGQSTASLKVLRVCLEQAKKPMVIDADAINLLANNLDLLHNIPSNSILTPHYKEFERLVGTLENSEELEKSLLDYAQKWDIVIVFKGPHTRIATPQGQLFYNDTGNSGLATAGSGDVLTGMIAGFLAQGADSLAAAMLGVFLHGWAADICANEHNPYSLTANTLLDYIPIAIDRLQQHNNRRR